MNLSIKNKVMRNLIVLTLSVFLFTSCEKSSPLDDYIEIYGDALTDTTTTNNSTNIIYEFDMTG